MYIITTRDNRRLTIGRLPINTKKLILLSYLTYLFRLQLLSEDSYLLKGLQSADKTKMHPLLPETEATLTFQQITYIHCEPKKNTKMFLSYLPQKPVDSDKIWDTLS